MRKTGLSAKPHSTKVKIGIVGCGAIGTELAEFVIRHLQQHALLWAISDRNREHAEALKKKLKLSTRFLSNTELIRECDFVIEAASQAAAKEIVPVSLKAGKKVMVMSVGGLLHVPKLYELASMGTLIVPSGAIAGIDALLAAMKAEVKRVSIKTRKPLHSLSDAPFWKTSSLVAKRIDKPTTLFKGSAQEAIKAFPQNINVAATLSLAGIGAERTEVEIIASPTDTQNTHEILIDGSFGRIRTMTQNLPSEANPKTSALAIYSAKACLMKVFSSIKIGT